MTEPIMGPNARAAMRAAKSIPSSMPNACKLRILIAAFADAGEASPSVKELARRVNGGNARSAPPRWRWVDRQLALSRAARPVHGSLARVEAPATAQRLRPPPGDGREGGRVTTKRYGTLLSAHGPEPSAILVQRLVEEGLPPDCIDVAIVLVMELEVVCGEDRDRRIEAARRAGRAAHSSDARERRAA